jgi:hypothetical protein
LAKVASSAALDVARLFLVGSWLSGPGDLTFSFAARFVGVFGASSTVSSVLYASSESQFETGDVLDVEGLGVDGRVVDTVVSGDGGCFFLNIRQRPETVHKISVTLRCARSASLTYICTPTRPTYEYPIIFSYHITPSPLLAPATTLSVIASGTPQYPHRRAPRTLSNLYTGMFFTSPSVSTHITGYFNYKCIEGRERLRTFVAECVYPKIGDC